MRSRTFIDVTKLPGSAFDSQAPVWWGNVLLMVIETVTLALLITSYFYVAQNFPEWPPPSVNRIVTQYNPAPGLTYGSWFVGLIVVATVPMIWADKGAHHMEKFPVLIGLSLATAAGIVAIVLRLYEFTAIGFRWNENAYASIVWGLLALHLLYLVFEVGEAGINILWTLIHGLDEKHAVDVTLSTGFWYWVAATAVVVYVVVYWAPRIM